MFEMIYGKREANGGRHVGEKAQVVKEEEE